MQPLVSPQISFPPEASAAVGAEMDGGVGAVTRSMMQLQAAFVGQVFSAFHAAGFAFLRPLCLPQQEVLDGRLDGRDFAEVDEEFEVVEEEAGQRLVVELAASFAVLVDEALDFDGIAFFEHGAVDDAEMAFDDVGEFGGKGSISVDEVADAASEDHLGMGGFTVDLQQVWIRLGVETARLEWTAKVERILVFEGLIDAALSVVFVVNVVVVVANIIICP